MDTYTVRSQHTYTHLMPIMVYFVTPFECRPFVFIIPLESSIPFHKDAISPTTAAAAARAQCARHTHTANNTIEAMNGNSKNLSTKRNKIER